MFLGGDILDPSDIKEIGKRFQMIRKELKLVQADIALETGVTIPVIKNLEGGRTKTINMPMVWLSRGDSLHTF